MKAFNEILIPSASTTYHGVRTANFENVLYATTARRQLLRLLAPVGDFLVVDDVVGTKRLELLALLGRRSGGNDLRASSLCKLHSKHADTASSLSKNPVTRLQAAAFQTVKTVPGGQSGARKGSTLQEVEVGGHGNETLLVEGAILLQRTVDGAADAGGHAVEVKRAGEMGLVEESEDLVTLLETSHARADLFDDTGAVRCWDDAFALGEGVESFDDGEIAVVEGGTVDCDLMLAGESRLA